MLLSPPTLLELDSPATERSAGFFSSIETDAAQRHRTGDDATPSGGSLAAGMTGIVCLKRVPLQRSQ